MAMDGFDTSDLGDFERDLLDLATTQMPRETKKFLRDEGTKLRKKTLSNAKSKVKKKTGNYYKSIKKGKVYKYSGNGAWSIRVYSSAHHAHLIEKGHRQITEDGREVGFVQGKRVFEDIERQFESEYFNDVNEFINEVLEKGL